MNRFIIKAVMVAVGLGVSLAPLPCHAAGDENDFRIGTFEGNWCGLPARFEITKKFGKRWLFEGKIFIKSTGQYDRIIVEQFQDNHLRMRRVLTGQHAGEFQVLETNEPETLLKGGKTQINFRVRHGSGIGTNNLGHLIMSTK